MSSEKGTERPWSYRGDYLVDANGDKITAIGDAYECSPEDLARDDANAELIVRCVNAHEGLVKALEFYANQHRYDYDETCCPNPARGCAPEGDDILADGGSVAREALASLAKDS
jgi:hypothetical protein